MKKLLLLLSLCSCLQATPLDEMKKKVDFLDEVIHEFYAWGKMEECQLAYLEGVRDGYIDCMLLIDETETKIYLTQK